MNWRIQQSYGGEQGRVTFKVAKTKWPVGWRVDAVADWRRRSRARCRQWRVMGLRLIHHTRGNDSGEALGLLFCLETNWGNALTKTKWRRKKNGHKKKRRRVFVWTIHIFSSTQPVEDKTAGAHRLPVLEIAFFFILFFFSFSFTSVIAVLERL